MDFLIFRRPEICKSGCRAKERNHTGILVAEYFFVREFYTLFFLCQALPVMNIIIREEDMCRDVSEVKICSTSKQKSVSS